MISKPSSPARTGQPSQRFIPPATPVDERIDQVAAYSTDKQHQAEWLKQTLREHWKGDLPQPFVGFRRRAGRLCARVAVRHRIQHAIHRR